MLWPAPPAAAQHDFLVIAGAQQHTDGGLPTRLFHIPVQRFEVEAEFFKVFRFEPPDLQFDRHYAITLLRLLDLAADGLAKLPVRIDQDGVDGMHRALPGGGNACDDFLKTGLGSPQHLDGCWHGRQPCAAAG